MRTVTCHQFIHTSKPAYGFVTLSSGRLALNAEQVALLRDPVGAEAKIGFEIGLAVTRLIAQPSDFMGVTYLSGQRDEFKRPFVQSHTILMPVDVYAESGTDLRLFFGHFIKSPADVPWSSELAPIDLTIDLGKSPEVAEVDSNLISRLLASADNLAMLISALLASERSLLRLGCNPSEAIELATNLLRLIPQGAYPLEIATFQPRVELSDRYKLLILPTKSPTRASSSGIKVEVTRDVGIRAAIRSLAEVTISGNLEEIPRIRKMVMDDYEENQRRRLVNLDLEAAAGRQQYVSLVQILKEATEGPPLFSHADARSYLDKLMKQQTINSEFRLRLVAHLILQEVPEQWLSDEVIAVILAASPAEFFSNYPLKVARVVRLLHDQASGQWRSVMTHERIADWLCHFDFEEELYRFVSPVAGSSSGSSLLMRLVNELTDISNTCDQCAKLIVRHYVDAFTKRLVDWPVYRWSPRLRGRFFEKPDQFRRALQLSNVLNALKKQSERLCLKKEHDQIENMMSRVLGLLS